MSKRSTFNSIAIAIVMACAASGVSAGVVATNEDVPSPQLVGDGSGTSADPTIYLYDGYTELNKNPGLDIGTYNPYIELHVTNNSYVTSSVIWYLGGDYPNMPGESGDYSAYPGHQKLLIDNSYMSTGELRVGSKNSYNTLIVQNEGDMDVNGATGLRIDYFGGAHDNAVIVTGAGSTLDVTSGPLYVGYGGSVSSYNESLTVLDGGNLTVGTAASTQTLRMRYTHDSTIKVSGLGSKIIVTGIMTLGESSTLSYGNKLILADGGELWIKNASNATNALTSSYASTQEKNKVELKHGFLVVKGNQTANTTIANLIWVWGGTGYVDGTVADNDGVNEAGEYTATYYTSGDYSGYTVFTGGVPEPTTMALLTIGGIGVLVRRRRK